MLSLGLLASNHGFNFGATKRSIREVNEPRRETLDVGGLM